MKSVRISIVSTLFVFFAAALSLSAQHIPLKIDGAQFRYNDSKNVWEFYYSFPDTAVVYRPAQQGGYVGSLHFRLSITSDSKGEVAGKEWIADNNTEQPIKRFSKNLIGQQTFVLPFGQYSVHLTAYDDYDSTKYSKRSYPLVIRAYDDRAIRLSDIQLAGSITSISDENAPAYTFTKHGLNVVPNPEHEFIGESPALVLYYEIYNAKKYAGDSLTIEYSVLDGAKREQFTVIEQKKIESDIHVQTAEIPINVVPSGVYYVKVSVRSVSIVSDSNFQIKKFYVLNPDIPVELAQAYTEDELFQRSEFATFSMDRVQEEFTKASVIATSAETELYKKLTELEAKRKFMFRFWYDRDPDKSTPMNEKYDDFCAAVKRANVYYSSIVFKEGWKSDPGRIMRKYGIPTQIDRHPQGGDSRPYEEWFYAGIQGGIYFQFVDMKGYGNFVQVNSTAIGESRNANWKQLYVQMNPGQNAQEDILK